MMIKTKLERHEDEENWRAKAIENLVKMDLPAEIKLGIVDSWNVQKQRADKPKHRDAIRLWKMIKGLSPELKSVIVDALEAYLQR